MLKTEALCNGSRSVWYKTSYILNTGCFKSPFFKGGFRGIIKRLFNPPLPSFRKGGRKNLD
jgi:hypothetical protein